MFFLSFETCDELLEAARKSSPKMFGFSPLLGELLFVSADLNLDLDDDFLWPLCLLLGDGINSETILESGH